MATCNRQSSVKANRFRAELEIKIMICQEKLEQADKNENYIEALYLTKILFWCYALLNEVQDATTYAQIVDINNSMDVSYFDRDFEEMLNEEKRKEFYLLTKDKDGNRIKRPV